MLWYLLLWHALAKLRQHTETSVNILERVTTFLGNSVRTFARKCRKIDTREMPKESAARVRRRTKKNTSAQKPASTKKAGASKETETTAKRKFLNLVTFKWHNLGHYVAWIRRKGTTDNYSTQVVSIRCLSSEGMI